MPRILDRKTVIEMLKKGAEVVGDPLSSYTIYLDGHSYDSWTVRADTLWRLNKDGLLRRTQSTTSTNYIYKWNGD